MEWVETTGKSVEEAREAALDQLGVHEDDADIEVLEEPRTGLFGRTRGEARVRARVRPTRPREKTERRDRRKRRTSNGGGKRSERSSSSDGPPVRTDRESSDKDRDQRPAGTGQNRRRSRGGRGRGGGQRSGGQTRAPKEVANNGDQEDSGMPSEDQADDATVEEQAAIMRTFVEGLVDAFDLDATFAEERVDEDTIELKVEGENLGLLIGPKGQTLQAVQELARTVVQRKVAGTHHGRVRIDIGAYRERRREALERFAKQVASDVVASGVAKALEPMHPADRKVVHDTINDIEGVETTSEGEEPGRRVVIMPAGSRD